jgi:ATP/maltotriose-dependent transcriptional regulator MalT
MAETRTTAPKGGRRRIIERPRLIRLLDESPARIKMLVAPAGYGKTTLARQWLERDHRTPIWVRCSGGDDVAAIAAAVAEAASAVIPGAERRILQRLPMTGEGSEEAALLAEIMAEEADRWPASAWIVLDDYERLTTSPTSEAFIAGFTQNRNVHVMLLTRAEPAWLTAKQIMYGDVVVLDRQTLSMTPEEARTLLPRAGDSAAIELARGWPAVLGLVAMSTPGSAVARSDLLPENLARFIAEELYEGLDVSLRMALWQIAVADTDDETALRELLGADSSRVFQTGEATGWIGRDVPGRIDLHPLLKRFLLDRVQAPDVARQPEVSRMVQALTQSRRWDEAFTLVEKYQLSQLVEPFLRSALYPALAAGRTTSVKRWMNYGAQSCAAPAIVGLARAEITYREGRFVEAEAIATAVANNLGESDELLFPALLLAGRAADTGTRPLDATRHYRRARALAQNVEERCRAAFGEIGAAADLELPETLVLLDEVKQHIPANRPDLLTVWISRALLCHARFARPIDLDAGRWGYQLLGQVEDAIARTAFRNVFSYMLIQACFVDEARSVLTAQREEAESLRLSFVTMYADHVEALLELALGNFEAAKERIDQLEADAGDAMNSFLLSNVISLKTRLLIALGQFEEAISSSFTPHAPTACSMVAEIQASRAVAYACSGGGRDATTEAEKAATTSSASEVLVLRASALAIVAILEARPDAGELAEAALSTALRLGMIEPFVSACRGYPELCALLFRSDKNRPDLRRLLAVAKDLAQLEPPMEASGSGSWRDLSPREQEVLLLIAGGMSNREIGVKLFISESTAKVHVRHILEKLGVRTRTEAALRAPPGARPH